VWANCFKNEARVTGADGTQTQLTYNGCGQALSVTNALGEQSTFAYQETAASPAFGRRTTETAAVGTALAAATSLGYDDSARVHMITNQDNDVVTLDYDAIGGAPLKSLDRVTTTTGPDGSGAWVLWDRLDVGERHEFYPGVAERVTTYTHNDNRELTDVLRPSGKTLSYVPGNCCGTMDTLVDAAGNQTHWEHDVLGRVTDKWLRWEQDGQVKVEHLEYDAAGRLGTAQDARGNVQT
jgi:YD repeat-containing protein